MICKEAHAKRHLNYVWSIQDASHWCVWWCQMKALFLLWKKQTWSWTWVSQVNIFLAVYSISAKCLLRIDYNYRVPLTFSSDFPFGYGGGWDVGDVSSACDLCLETSNWHLSLEIWYGHTGVGVGREVWIVVSSHHNLLPLIVKTFWWNWSFAKLNGKNSSLQSNRYFPGLVYSVYFWSMWGFFFPFLPLSFKKVSNKKKKKNRRKNICWEQLNLS